MPERGRWTNGILWLALLAGGVVMMFPLLWMVATSLKNAQGGIFPTGGHPLAGLFPETLHWENYREVFRKVDFARYYLNSVLVAGVVTFGQLATCSLAAYAFSRLRFSGRDPLFFCYLGTLMVPGTVTLIPTFMLLAYSGLVDSYWALLLPPMFSAYGTFLLRQFFMGIPVELEEAAMVDGCSIFGIYWRVILPLSGPALATLGIFAFLGNWQSLLYPLVMIHSDELKTLPLGLLNFVDLHAADWPRLMAASLLSIIPIILIFLFGQRYFVGGIRLGGVKG